MLSAIDVISYVVVGIYNDSRRQIERDLPDLGPFRDGLVPVKSLNAKDIFSQIYCVFLALSNSYLDKDTWKKERKRPYNEDNTPILPQKIERLTVSC